MTPRCVPIGTRELNIHPTAKFTELDETSDTKLVGAIFRALRWRESASLFSIKGGRVEKRCSDRLRRDSRSIDSSQDRSCPLWRASSRRARWRFGVRRAGAILNPRRILCFFVHARLSRTFAKEMREAQNRPADAFASRSIFLIARKIPSEKLISSAELAYAARVYIISRIFTVFN